MNGSPRGLGLGLDGRVLEEEENGSYSTTVSPSKHTAFPRLQHLGSPSRRRDGTTSMTSSFLSPMRSRAGSQAAADGVSDYAESVIDTEDQSMSMLSTADPAEIDELEEGVRQSRTIEDFTKIITEFRLNRKSAYAESLGVNTETGSQWGDRSDAGSDAGSTGQHSRRRRSISGDSTYGTASKGRCTCCCSRDDCPSAIRARQEWRDLEADLRLSAEIGQALLKRHDAMHAKSQKQAQEYIQQRDGLMSRLSKSYKETSGLERQLAQANLNLEAADSSNRTLLHELDEVRGQLAKLKTSQNKLAGADEKARRLASELDDAKQELAADRKRADAAEAKAKKMAERSSQLSDSLKQAKKEVEIASIRRNAKVSVSEEALEAARQRLGIGMREAKSSESGKDGAIGGHDDEVEVSSVVESLVKDNEALRQSNAQLQELLDARTDELAAIREQDAGSIHDHASVSSPQPSHHSRPPSSLGFGSSYRIPTASISSVQDGLGPEVDIATGDQPAVSLSDEMVVPEGPSASGSSAPPVTVTRTPSTARRAQPPRSLSRSSAASSSNAATFDGLQDSPRSAATGLLSPTTTATTSAQQGDTPSRRGASKEPSGTSAQHASGASRTGEYESFAAEAAKRERDTRTGQLSTLLDYINRLFTRLSSADVDTLTRRLQRQHLAGDVGHLARTTVNSILRDVDGLRDHFRRIIEQESRQNARDDASTGSRDMSSESQVARKEFFALLKAFRDILCEVARLRLCINEIHMNPGNAAKLLQEHLGATAAEDKSLLPIPSAVGWLGKMLLGGPSAGGTTSGNASLAGSSAAASALGGSGSGNASESSAGTKGGKAGSAPRMPGAATAGGSGAGARLQPTRAISGGSYTSHLAPRASAAVVSSSVAVEVKGLHASAAENLLSSTAGTGSMSTSPPVGGGGLQAGPRPKRGRAPGSLSRVQSRNLSGLFAGTLGNPEGFGASPSARIGGSSYSSTPSHRRDATGLSNSLLAGARGGAGGMGSPARQRPLSRIVDDDEVSLHHGRSRHGYGDADDSVGYPGALLERTLRPRGLSDSSIRSSFLDAAPGGGVGAVGTGSAGVGPSPVARIITPATLALQYDASTSTAAAYSGDDAALPRGLDEDGRSDNGSASTSTTTTSYGAVGGVGEKVTSLWKAATGSVSGGSGFVGAGTTTAAAAAAGGKAVRQTPSIAALNRAAARAEEAAAAAASVGGGGVAPRGSASRGQF